MTPGVVIALTACAAWVAAWYLRVVPVGASSSLPSAGPADGAGDGVDAAAESAPDPSGSSVAAGAGPVSRAGTDLAEAALAADARPAVRSLAVLGPWGVLALVVVLAVLWMPAELTATYQVRIAMVLVALVPVAVVDLRHGVVPDAVLVALLGVRAVVLGIDVARDVPGVWLALRAEVAVAVVILAVLGLARLVNRRSIGVGDLKLFAVLPLLLGPQLAIWSIMASFVAAFVYTVFVLSTKRRSRRAAIPFAPFVLLGTLAAVVLVSLPGS